MSAQHCKRIDQLLHLFGQDDESFNRTAEAQQLGIYHHRGRGDRHQPHGAASARTSMPLARASQAAKPAT